VIILPFCNWNFNHTGLNAPWLWVTTENTPFNQVKQIPVRYESTLAQSCFSADYNLERIDACLDSLTVLYVAFTRAEDALFAFCPVGTKVNTVADALYAELKDDLTGDLVFLAGDMSFRNSSAVVTASQESALPVPMIAGKMKDEVRHRSQADSETTRFGRIVHQVLENVTCPADLGPSLNRMVSSGMVSQAESEFVHIFISRLFNNPVVNEWFSGDWEVLTEAAILVPGGAERRPDRVLIRGDQSVVIDYKTGTRKPVHQQQVSEYMDLLKSMGYSNVRGFLLYLDEGAVAEVKERAGSFQPGLWDQEA
jgi:ATP-dependent exoDNAse (exonuclease V) beta subunit